MKAAAWIDRVKSARGWESDYRAAKELGIKANTISNYRAHGTPMDEAIALKIAHALNIDPAIILTDQAMERTKNDEARSAWSAILERLGGVAASIVLGACALGGLGAAPDAQAFSRSQSHSNEAGDSLYIV